MMIVNFSEKDSVKTIAQGAIIITIIIICLVFIRGVFNILNSIFIPLAIYLFSIDQKVKGVLMFFIALLVICILFFYTQIIFLTLYFLIAQILTIMKRLKSSRVKSIIILSVFNSITFWVAIILTDFIFGLNINHFMLTIFSGNQLLYIVLLFAEGIFSSVILILVSDALHKRLVLTKSESSLGVH